MRSEQLLEALYARQDLGYREMMIHSLATVDANAILGVRTPELRRLAKELEDGEAFLNELPHRYFEENQIHSFFVEQGRDFDQTISRVEAFLPYIDNWATCDQWSPKAFRNNHQALLPYIRKWLQSDHPYTVRFGIKVLMDHFLTTDFAPEYPDWVAEVRSDHYYVKMMAAWYFATALAKQYDAILPYITQFHLEKWIHNKTIQKAVESYRISPEQKAFLRQYRQK